MPLQGVCLPRCGWRVRASARVNWQARREGSAESKPVDASNETTGKANE